MLTKLFEYLKSNFNLENIELTGETKLISSGIIDSINTLKLVDFIEDSFEIELEASEVSRDNLDTPNLIIELINRKKAPN